MSVLLSLLYQSNEKNKQKNNNKELKMVNKHNALALHRFSSGMLQYLLFILT